MKKSSLSPWVWYAALWVLDGAAYSTAIAEFKPGLGWTRAIQSGVQYVVPSALLGVGVWQLTRVIRWPPRRLPIFIASHIALAMVFAGVGLGAEVLYFSLF